MKVDETYTIEQFINMKSSDEITYYNFSILSFSNGIEFPITNLIYDYLDELRDESYIISLTDDQLLRYQYRPYLLSYDLYGATEASFVILALNGIIDDDEFDITNVRVISKESLSRLMGKIFSTEQKYINTNRSKIKEIEKTNNKTVGL